jgi:alkylation response protein AidB-like acyl-CoA dehydrogenase
VKLALDEEQNLLKDSVARFVRDNYSIERRRALRDAGEGYDAALWGQMAELGWLGLSFAEEDGGLGASLVETLVVMEELGRGLATEPYLVNVVLCGGLLSRCEADIRSAYLPGLIAGESQWALAYAEDRGGYALDRVQATAQHTAEGWRVTGEKIAVMNAGAAQFFLVTAAVDGQVGLFLVEREQAQAVHPVNLVDGSRGGNVSLADSPAIQLLADGLPALESLIDEALLAVSAQALGSMEALLEQTVDYTRTREQFGQPIGKFQALQHRMADMFLHCQSLRSLLLAAIIARDKSPREASRAASAVKVKLDEAGSYVSQQAVQLHGGIGMSDELAVGHHFKSLLLLNTLFGDGRHHLQRYLALQ